MYSIIILFSYIVGKTSVQLASLRSKTGLSRRSLIVRLKRSTKTAARLVFLEKCLLLLFRNF